MDEVLPVVDNGKAFSEKHFVVHPNQPSVSSTALQLHEFQLYPPAFQVIAHQHILRPVNVRVVYFMLSEPEQFFPRDCLFCKARCR